MDAVDERIIRELTLDARLPFRELGARVGLSANAAAARVRRLLAEGTITGFTVRRGTTAPTGEGLEVFVDVRLREGVSGEDATRAFALLPEIVDAVHVTGPYDYLLHAVVPDPAGLDALVRRLKVEARVSQTSTRLALRTPAR